MKPVVAEAIAALVLASGSGDGGRAAAWANVPDVFPTLTVSFVSLRLSRSGNGVDKVEVFVMVAAQAPHPDLGLVFGADQDLDLERGWASFVLPAD